MHSFLTIGLIGLAVQVTVNLLVMLVFRSASAKFFTEDWWSAWFPTDVV